MGQSDLDRLVASTKQLIVARQALCESLNKTRELGLALSKSDTKLRSISGRLLPIQEAMGPLLNRTESARNFAVQIEGALTPAKAVLKKFEDLRMLEVTLMREPKDNLEAYLVAVQSLDECISFLKQNSGSSTKLLQDAAEAVVRKDAIGKVRGRRLAESISLLKSHRAGDLNSSLDSGLLGIALEKLAKEFKRIMVQHTLPLTLPDRLDPEETKDITEQIMLPPAVLKRLQAIMQNLATNGGLEKCVESYREIRSTRAFVSLQGLKLDYLKTCNPESLEKIDWDILQTMIGKWTEHIEVAVKVLYASEKRLCEQVLGKVARGAYVDECLYKVARIGMGQFISFGEGIARSHRAPEKLFKLLDMYYSLDKCMSTVNYLFDGECCRELRSQVRELQKMVVAQACRTFWEFKQWVVEQHEGSMAHDGSVTKLSSYVVNYLKYLVSEFYNPIMDKVLKIEQSWRGQGRVEESGLANGVLLFIQALERQIEGRSNEYSDPALRHIFLMNNLWYMRTRSKKCELGQLLGEQWLSEQRRKVEEHALAYEHEVWGAVLKCLSKEGSNAQGGRNAVRDLAVKRLRDFTVTFDNACQRHQRWLIAEEDLREGTKNAVLQAVVPAYRKFLSSFEHVLETGAGSKNYYKYTPENIEHMISELLNGRLELTRSGSNPAGHGAHGRQGHMPYAEPHR